MSVLAAPACLRSLATTYARPLCMEYFTAPKGQGVMCLSRSECRPQPGQASSTDSAKEPRALEPEILLSVTLTVSADAAWTQDMSDVRLVTPPCPLCVRSLVLVTESALLVRITRNHVNDVTIIIMLIIIMIGDR